MKRNINLLIRSMAFYAAILFFAGCTQDEGIKPKEDLGVDTRGPIGPGTGGGAGPKTVYGLTDNNQLQLLKLGPPITVVSSVTLSVPRGDVIRAIDFRGDGGLYGVSSGSTIYLIDPATGVCKAVGGAFVPGIKGGLIGFDFDPKNDQIRIVTDLDQNIRVDPNTGALILADTDINPAVYNMNAIAYGYNYASRTYPLYDIDVSRGYLTRQDPQNGGVITPIGPLNMVISGEGGFDILRSSNSTVGTAALFGRSLLPSTGTADNLNTDAFRIWDINLQSAKTTYRGKLSRNIIGLAIP
ncbi:MAG TPA: DUF4394 domain-containing protein [Saprospiraceae bacterium]|nr:DUF4394 domain-containing protein [Saprospiraceae bacterium]